MPPDPALPKTLAGWLDLLERRHVRPIQLGLDRVSGVYAAMGGKPQGVVFMVAGTNGKGSVCALLEAMLLAEGYRVGCYTSPHLLYYNERVRLNGEPVDDETLVASFGAVEKMREDVDLTYFEHGTLAALDIFRRNPLDALILEVGLGGRLDAVNVVGPDCAIVTCVDVDHTEYLGEDREAIGREKAGIFRAGGQAVCGEPSPPASLLAHAEALQTRLWLCGRDYGFTVEPHQWAYWRVEEPGKREKIVKRGGLAHPALRGGKQIQNAATALMALDTVRERLPLSMQAIRQGMMLVTLPGRFQVLPGRPAMVLDVAHNPQAAAVLADGLGRMGFFARTIAVLGMLADKDVGGVVSAIRKNVDDWFLVGLPGPRGLPVEQLAERVTAAGVEAKTISRFTSPAEAFAAAAKSAQDDDRIVVLGSFLTVADILAAIQAQRH